MTTILERAMATSAARIGHNGGPPLDEGDFDAIKREIDDLYEEAKNWCDGEPIADQQQADAVTSLMESLHEAGKRADALRVERKKPLDDAVKAIQDKFNPLIQPKRGRVDMGKLALQQLLTPWRQKLASEAAARAVAAAAEAAALRAKANEAMQASAGNLEAREVAEQAHQEAKAAERQARRQETAATSGLGLRTVWEVEMIDLSEALTWAYTTRRSSMEDFVRGLATEAVHNGARLIPGFEVREKKVATV